MMNRYFFILAIVIIFSNCIDEIELNVDTEERTLVVDGFVSDIEDAYQLKLSSSSVIGVGRDNILDPVPNAEVTLKDNSNGSFPYVETEPGIYILTGFQAQPDIFYYIDIRLADGRHYQSIPAKLRSSSVIGTVSYEVGENTFRDNKGDFVTKTIISVNIETDISGSPEPPFLRWRVEGEYAFTENYPEALSPRRCYIKSVLDLNDIRIFDTSELSDGKLFGQVIAEAEYDHRFAEQFCFHIFQFSISEEEYDYWENIKEITEISGSLFDPPPGTLVGNIFNVDNENDIAVGYFSVASTFFKREFINGAKLDKLVQPICTDSRRRDNGFGCTDCTLIRDSSLEQPDYWEF